MLKLYTQGEHIFHKRRHDIKLKGRKKQKKYSVHKQQIISIYINYASEKKKVYSHMSNGLSHRLSH